MCVGLACRPVTKFFWFHVGAEYCDFISPPNQMRDLLSMASPHILFVC